MVEKGKNIKLIGIAIAAVLVIALAAGLLAGWNAGWFGSKQEDAADAQAKLMVYENGAITAQPIGKLSDFIAEADKPIFIDFWAEWCAPCKLAAPFVESLAQEYDGRAYIVKVNIDEQPGIANAYRIQSIPTFMVIEDGEIKSAKMGYADQLQPELKSMIDLRLQ
jgi:thioredoxin